jgi:fucose permease
MMGVGLGLTVPTTNLLVSDLNPEKRAAALSLVNFSWGIGAVASPLLVGLLQQVNPTALLQYAIAAVLIILAASLKFFAFPARAGTEERSTAHTDSRIWRNRFVPILGALFFLYVGSETSVGGWIATYAQRVMTNAGATWAMMPSFFWAALLAGRGIAPLILQHIAEERVARAGLTLAALGIVLLLVSRNGWELAASAGLAGLGFSSVYPIVIANLSHKFGSMASRIGGLTFTLAGLGGATLPLLVGYLSTRYTSLRTGLIVPLLGCSAMFTLHLLLSNPARRSSDA